MTPRFFMPNEEDQKTIRELPGYWALSPMGLKRCEALFKLRTAEGLSPEVTKALSAMGFSGPENATHDLVSFVLEEELYTPQRKA